MCQNLRLSAFVRAVAEVARILGAPEISGILANLRYRKGFTSQVGMP
jgi:hypothetical protein